MSAFAKQAHDIMLSTGLLSYWSSQDILNVGKAGIDAGSSTVMGAWNNSEDTYRETGESIGEVAGSTAMGLANAAFMFDAAKRHGIRSSMFREGWAAKDTVEAKHWKGIVYEELEGGGFKPIGKPGAPVGGLKHFFKGSKILPNVEEAVSGTSTLGKEIAKGGMSGTLTRAAGVVGAEAKFYKNLGFVKGLAPFVGAMAFGSLAKGVLGFAGGLVDEAVKDEHRFRHLTHDTRFFNTERDEMSNYMQLGQAMNNYSMRVQNTARIYHAR